MMCEPVTEALEGDILAKDAQLLAAPKEYRALDVTLRIGGIVLHKIRAGKADWHTWIARIFYQCQNIQRVFGAVLARPHVGKLQTRIEQIWIAESRRIQDRGSALQEARTNRHSRDIQRHTGIYQ